MHNHKAQVFNTTMGDLSAKNYPAKVKNNNFRTAVSALLSVISAINLRDDIPS